jgi:hypothetical protein
VLDWYGPALDEPIAPRRRPTDSVFGFLAPPTWDRRTGRAFSGADPAIPLLSKEL